MLDGRRVLPSAKLAAYVHHFWWVRWSLRSPFEADTLPHPSARITLAQRAELFGVHTGRLAGRLVGKGQTFGITFRPVMFQPLLCAPMATLTDHVVPLATIFGARTGAWARAIRQARHLDDKIALAESFLESLLPPPSARLARLRDLVERMAVDRSILRVEDVCEASGLEHRALLRQFRTYVGVGPKWVIQRYRLHEATVQLAGANPPSLAALAANLGYADQAHFGRDFKRVIGQTPRSFERSKTRG